MTERDRIVEWLREQDRKWCKERARYEEKGNYGPYLGGPSYHHAAIAISRGEHMKGSTND